MHQAGGPRAARAATGAAVPSNNTSLCFPCLPSLFFHFVQEEFLAMMNEPVGEGEGMEALMQQLAGEMGGERGGGQGWGQGRARAGRRCGSCRLFAVGPRLCMLSVEQAAGVGH